MEKEHPLMPKPNWHSCQWASFWWTKHSSHSGWVFRNAVCCPLRNLTKYCSLLHIMGSPYFRYYCSLDWVPREWRSSVLVKDGLCSPDYQRRTFVICLPRHLFSTNYVGPEVTIHPSCYPCCLVQDHFQWFIWVETLPVLFLEEERTE